MSMSDNPMSLDLSPRDTTDVNHRSKVYPGTALPDKNHIRLVELLTQQIGAGGGIRLKFRNVRLETAPDFTALSYTWGTPSLPQSIQGFHITDNLLSALVNLAQAEPKLWWIDALCINQSDLDEKPEQIKLMRQIYKKAKQVCVWLGNPDNISIELLQKICENVEKQKYPRMDFSDAVLEEFGLPGFKSPAWGSLMQFLARPYFRRVWVLQELVMARKPVLVACGEARFTWYLITVATSWLRENYLTPLFASRSYELSQEWRFKSDSDLIYLTLSLELRDEPLFLEFLIGVSCYLESTDPRDKIIALMGLVSEQDHSIAKIKIDYRQPVADFYREVTGTIITTHRSLKLLSLVTDTSSGNIQGLPSWVPDYSTETERSIYRTGHFLIPCNPIDVQWHPGSNALHILGHIADEVQFVAEDAATNGSDTELVLLSWFKAAAHFKSADEWSWIVSLANASTAVDRDVEQFWRTIIMDVAEGHSPAPEEYREHFAKIVFLSFVKEKSGDINWLIGFGANLARFLREEFSEDQDPQCDDMIASLIRLATQARSKDSEIELPDWRIPTKWITLNKEDKYILQIPGSTTSYIVQMNSWGIGRFFITRAGRMGRGPRHMRQGEQIALVKGTEQVFLLRKDADNTRFVGECYVHGLMRSEEKGEAIVYKNITLI